MKKSRHRLINCPHCNIIRGPYGNRIPYGYCSFCHGQRKVNTFYLQWCQKKGKYMEKQREIRMKEMQDALKTDETQWSLNHNAPLKF